MVSILCGGEDLFLLQNNPMQRGDWRFVRKRQCAKDGEVSLGVQDLRRLKRLRLTDDAPRMDPNSSIPDSDEQECKALILRPLTPDEHCFRVAVSSDLPESTLGILLRADGAAASERKAKEDSVESLDHVGKELVIYQTPPTLPDLLKEAAFLDGHHMELD